MARTKPAFHPCGCNIALREHPPRCPHFEHFVVGEDISSSARDDAIFVVAIARLSSTLQPDGWAYYYALDDRANAARAPSRWLDIDAVRDVMNQASDSTRGA